MDFGDVGARGEAHGVVGRGHGSLHLRSKAAAVALLLLVLLLGSRGVVLVMHVGHCEEGATAALLFGSLEGREEEERMKRQTKKL